MQDYQNDRIITDELYKGYTETVLTSDEMDHIFQNGLVLPAGFMASLFPNEFIHIVSSDDIKHEVLARFDGEKNCAAEICQRKCLGLDTDQPGTKNGL